jgi:hypothetical protein
MSRARLPRSTVHEGRRSRARGPSQSLRAGASSRRYSPTWEHDLDTGFQFLLVRVRTHQPDRQDLIEVRRLADDVGEEQLAASSQQQIRQVIRPALVVESSCIDHVGDADIDIRQLGNGFATALEVTAKESRPKRSALWCVRDVQGGQREFLRHHGVQALV